MKADRGARIFTCPSSLADRATVSILSSTEFVTNFIKTDHERLAEHYKRTTQFLSYHRISYRPSNSGFFVWADLFSFWSPRIVSKETKNESSGRDSIHQWELEDRLNEHLYKYKVFLAAGKSFGSEEAGWFRLTFALRQSYLDEGLRRVVEALETFNVASQGPPT